MQAHPSSRSPDHNRDAGSQISHLNACVMSDTRALPVDLAREAIVDKQLALQEGILDEFMEWERDVDDPSETQQSFEHHCDVFNSAMGALIGLDLMSAKTIARLQSISRLLSFRRAFEEDSTSCVKFIPSIAADPVAVEIDARWLVVARAIKRLEGCNNLPPTLEAFLKNDALLQPFRDAAARPAPKRECACGAEECPCSASDNMLCL